MHIHRPRVPFPAVPIPSLLIPAAPIAAALIAAAVILASSSPAARAQVQPPANSRPVAVAVAETVPEPRDVPYPGTIALDIDASDVTTGAFRVTETIPVAPGTTRLTLLFPRWLPGNHAPRGPIAELADLRFFSGGRPLAWTRDRVDVFAFHVDVPAGASEVVARFVHTSPLRPAEGRVVMTREMLNLQWEKMSLYPAGHFVRQIRVKPSATFPAGWQAFTALDGKSGETGRIAWDVTDYETLVDSPVFAGLHAKRFDLGRDVRIDAVADKPELLAIKPENLQTYRNLVDEALATFGARHFDHYDLLLALTDRMGGIGLEHHRSSENQYEPRSWIDWDRGDWDRNVIAHELVHSWDGKFRRPARLWTPDYRQPMQDDLLWIYEGQTQFWGHVLAARSGIQSKEMILATMATSAGLYTQHPGRDWRSVEDTGHDPIVAARKAKPYASLAREEDYYSEGALIWLEADQIIRDGTGGRKGLDDFARAFFGLRDGDWGVVTYELDDVVKMLDAIHPYDWAGFFRTRIQTPGQPAPLGGIERGGYRLVWKEEPNAYDAARFAYSKYLSLTHSLGVVVDNDGKVTASRWESPAFRAGIVTGMTIVAVGGTAYSPETIKAAIAAARGGAQPVELLVRRDDRYATIRVDYRDGLRWPWLERAAGARGPGGLDRLLAPRRAAR